MLRHIRCFFVINVKEFPHQVQKVMREKDIAATCIPVQFDDGSWESAFFFHVAGPESKQDRRCLKKDKHTPALLTTELMTHSNASVVLIRFEVQTIVDDPLVFEILLVPGKFSLHYECLKFLAKQKRIRFFFADSDYRVLQEQEREIGAGQHEKFETLAREAFAHDSVLRMTGKYNAQAALTEVVTHYSPRIQDTGKQQKTTH